MRLENYSQEEIENMSLIELARLVLLAEKQPKRFIEVFDKVSELKQLTDAQKQDKISQFYTDLNIDGSFVMSGGNTWGLKRWYRVAKEDPVETPRRRRSAQEIDIDELDIDSDEFDMLDSDIDVVDEEDLDDDTLDDDLDDEFTDDFDDEDLDVDFSEDEDDDMFEDEEEN